ncbi:MAG: hypothetical protein J1F39_03725 [Clostridiales bacterium]|nr:hypothetical protein [Clostridiales bacterium]
MRKINRKIALTSFLVILFTLVCAVFLIACDKQEATTKKYTVTWKIDSNVQVEIIDGTYSEKMEVKDGATLSFKLNFSKGWEAASVKAGKSTVRATNGVYTTAAIKEDTEITVTSKEVLDHITAVLKDEDAVYYAGDEIKVDDIVVTAYYKTDRHEEVAGAISYQGEEATALSLGDTKFYVTYLSEKTEVEFDAAIKGLITLNLNGGKLSAEELAKLPSHKVVTAEKVTWTFDTALANDIELPVPTLVFDENDPNTEMPFVRWSGDGVANNKIATGTNTSVVVGALYNIRLVDITDMKFALKENKPYLIVKGELVYLTASLFIYEGNNPPKAYDPNLKVNQGTEGEFTLEMDLAALAQAKPVYAGDGEKPDNFPESLIGCWLDIRFRSEYNGALIQQELFWTGNETFADINDQVVAKVGDNFYRFFFETWSPEEGDAITGGNGAQFTGDETILKLHYEETAPYMQTGVALEKKTFPETAEAAYLVVSGKYLGDLESKEDFENKIKNIYIDLQNNDGANGGGWGMYIENGGQKVDVDYNEKGENTFKIYLSLAGLVDGNVAFSHFGASNTNLVMKIAESSIELGTKTYTLKNWTGWGSQLVCVFVADSSVKSFGLSTVGLEADEEHVYLVYSGTYKGYNKEEIEALLAKYSIDMDNGGRKLLTLTAVVNDTNSTFTLKADISDTTTYPAIGFYYMHGAVLEGDQTLADLGEAANIKESICAIAEGKGTVTFNGIKYTLAAEWGTRGVKIEEASPATYTIVSAKVVEQDGKAVIVITGTVVNYREGARFYIDAQENGNGWATTEQTKVTVSAEGGNFTVTWDLSDLVAEKSYYIHVIASGQNLNPSVVDGDHSSVTVGDVTYTLRPGGTDVQIEVAPAAAA